MRPPTIPTTIPVNRDDSKQVVRMKSLYNSLIEHRESKTHRILVQLFMCLPSRKDFPEYFSIIEKPIAMNRIRDRIERQWYTNVDACMSDFKLMFNNCKLFNEDDSQIYQDAVTLENILNRQYRESESPRLLFTDQLSAQASSPVQKVVDSTANATKRLDTANRYQNDTSTPLSMRKKSSKFHSQSDGHTPSLETDNATLMSPSRQDNNKLHNGQREPMSNGQQKSTNNNHSSSDSQLTNGLSTNSAKTSTSNMYTNNLPHTEHNSLADSIQTNDSMDSLRLNTTDDADLLASTPVEKCSLNTRRGKNADVPKRQLLTGYIIYASEIRKQVIDKNPNQNFGDISRLVGNEWKALPHDIRSKYDQRALIHNKRVREKAIRDEELGLPTNGLLHTPKMTKRKLAKLAKEQMRQHHLSYTGHDDSSTQSPKLSQDHSSSMVSQVPSSTYKHPHNQHSQPQSNPQAASSKITTAESSTQTIAIRFVEPPTKKRLVYSESFKKYIESLQVPNRDLLAEETTPDRPAELPVHWLGAGIGRHESAETALWALRDFLLQDAVSMRRSMEPYL